ncbi:MAG: hypothetical protein RMX68_022320 [Aulosira sp. ZfuVER01]|nr:hypothetical protein [Aulosira sp. ZfuVER01]MDZ8002972.1 hypothetical protein [Aulosira sp. DedVER01a]MDZ8053513.1 hypothetical protein [Aulosira sp. ZfuCHP01]
MLNTIDGWDKQRQVKLSESHFDERIRWCAREAHLDSEEAQQAREEAKNITKLTQQARAKARQATQEAREARERIQRVKEKVQGLGNRGGGAEGEI